MINRVICRPDTRPPCRLLPAPIHRLHPIHHIRRLRLPPRYVLLDAVVNPATPNLSAMYALRLGPRSLRLYVGFHALRTAYVPLSVRSSPHADSLRMLTLSAPRSLCVGSSCVPLSFPECTLVLQSLRDPITHSSLPPCLSCSLAVERTLIPTSGSVSFAALDTASP